MFSGSQRHTVTVAKLAYADGVVFVEPFNKANIFLCLMEYELNSLLGASTYQFIFDSRLKDIY